MIRSSSQAATLLDQTARPDLKEAKLLAAARQLFLDQGFAATSMDQVANRASASKTTLYTRFPSKELLFQAVITAECDAFGMNLRFGEFDGMAIDDALVEIGRRFMELVYSPQALRMEQIIAAEGSRFPALVEIFVKAGPDPVWNAISAFMRGAAERGVLKPGDPKCAAEMFLALIKGCAYGPAPMSWQAGTQTEAERACRLRAAVALFLDGMRVHAG